MSLLVRINEGGGGEDRILSFDSSPVRVGRNRLNDIPLDQLFVSQWHALIRFQGNEVTVMDLGSTNGTIVNGQKLPSQAPVALTSPNDLLQIGPICMTFGFGPSQAHDLGGPEATVEERLFDAQASAEWMTRMTGGATSQAQQDMLMRLSMERIGLLLETFARSYVELREGSEQFGHEMGIKIVGESSPLHDAKSYREVLDYLLDWNADGSERVDVVKRAFAELALHQVAFLHGVMAGVRDLLKVLSPGSKPSWGPFKAGAALAEQQQKIQSFVDEDRFVRVLFGKEFERAYYAVSGSGTDREPKQ